LHRRIDVTRQLMPGLTQHFIHSIERFFLMDKNSNQCKKHMRQQIAHMMAM
jgi:hypothetical protein